MPHLTTYIGLADHSEQMLAEALRTIAEGHARVADVFHTAHLLAGWSEDHRKALAPVIKRYGEADVNEPERLHAAGLAEPREGEIGLLRDLQDLHLLATLVHTTWTVIAQGAQGLRDHELLTIATDSNAQTSRQLSWLTMRMKTAAPQALIIAP